MKKYYIGLLVLAVITIGFLGFTIYQGSLSKQDKAVQKRAESIAKDLNEYVSDENEVPDSLKSAGIDDIPEEISYEKLSDKRYRFCVNYKTASNGYSVGAWDIAWSTFLASRFPAFDSLDSDYEPEELYINTFGHPKGKDCQTIKPYLTSFDEDSLDLDNSYEDQICDPTSSFYEFYKDYCAELSDNPADEIDTQEN